MSKITVEEIIAERREKAMESRVMSSAARGQGHAGHAEMWEMSADWAEATADHLERLSKLEAAQ